MSTEEDKDLDQLPDEIPGTEEESKPKVAKKKVSKKKTSKKKVSKKKTSKKAAAKPAKKADTTRDGKKIADLLVQGNSPRRTAVRFLTEKYGDKYDEKVTKQFISKNIHLIREGKATEFVEKLEKV